VDIGLILDDKRGFSYINKQIKYFRISWLFRKWRKMEEFHIGVKTVIPYLLLWIYFPAINQLKIRLEVRQNQLSSVVGGQWSFSLPSSVFHPVKLRNKATGIIPYIKNGILTFKKPIPISKLSC